MTSQRIAIIGGGPGGLMTAYLLERRTRTPLDITIFEAGPRLGGKIVTRQFESAPVTYEAGAAELYDYSRLGPDPLRDLIAELGLTVQPMTGGTVVLDEKFLTTEADIRRELGDAAWNALARFNRKARAAISPAEYYESDWQVDNADPLSRHTFRALLARIPDPAARRYVEVAVHSDLATEPHRTSAMYGLQNYLMDTPGYMGLYTIEGGIERLPRELAARLSAQIHLHRPVVRVEKTSSGHYRIDCPTSSDKFDFVVVALPNNWIPAIEWRGAELAAAMYRHHRHYNYPAHYLRVSVLFEKPFWRDRISDSYFMLDAFGGCCVYDESSRNGADTHGVLGWLLAGEAALNLGNLSDAELAEAVLDSLPRCLRHGRKWFLEGQVHRWANTVNGLPGGFPVKEPDSRHVPDPVHHPQLFVVGDYLFDSTVNGVLDSADVVAEWILEEIAEGPPTNGSANGCKTSFPPVPALAQGRIEI
jgi:monoamine oxidase